MSKPTLSICIPTYNRSETLKRLIDSIVNQYWFNHGVEIEIVINDGPSIDNTKELVGEYQKKYENIRYFRNTKAIGMLPAILEAISFSNGEYTRLFWSDDFMQNNALEIMLDIIKLQRSKIILSNRILFNQDADYNTANTSTKKYISFEWFSDFLIYLWLNEKNEFENKHNYFTFMSVFCFNTLFYKESSEFVLKNICSKWDLDKNYFNYILILFSKIFSKDIITIIEQPYLVYCQPENHNWNHNSKIVKDIITLTSYVKKNYPISDNWKKTLNKFVFRWLIATYIVSPIKNIFKRVGIYHFFSFYWRKYVLHNEKIWQ